MFAALISPNSEISPNITPPQHRTPHLAELCSLGEEIFVLGTTANTDLILLVQLCQHAFANRENRALVAWKQVV